jgi:hypothetical protein
MTMQIENNMNNTIISCMLALMAIVLFVISIAFSRNGWEGLGDLKWLLPLWSVIVVVAIIGFIFSITAIIKERSIFSWICFVAYLLPPIFIFVINPKFEYLEYKARKAAEYDSPQSQERREKMYGKYNLPASLDISIRNKLVSAKVIDSHYPILSIFNFGDGLWYFSNQEAGMERNNKITSLAQMIELDKSVASLLTVLPAMHYATRKDTKSPWAIGEFSPPSMENEGK